MAGWAWDNRPHFENKGQLSDNVVLDNTRSSKLARYKRAILSIRTRRDRLDKDYSRVKAFVKSEKTEIDKLLNKPPRLIQFRSYEYCFFFKSYLLLFDLVVKDHERSKNIILPNKQQLRDAWTKFNTDDVNVRNIVDAWNSYSDPCAILLDHSKFDGHYELDLCLNEHYFWTVLLHSTKFFDWLLERQASNKGFTHNGIKYFVRGKRMSGDANTSNGNTASNTFMIITWCDVAGVTEFHLFINGDDSIIITSMESKNKLMKLGLEFFREMFMETTMEDIAYALEEITYCQRKLCNLGGVWRWVKNPARTLGRFAVGPAQYAPVADRYLLGNALCELHVSYGVPILQAWCLRVIHDNLTSTSKPLGSVDKEAAKSYLSTVTPIEIRPISGADRHSFYLAWGITPEQQIRMESDLAATPQITPLVQTFINKYRFFIYN